MMGKPRADLYVGGSFKPCWVAFPQTRTPKGIGSLKSLSIASRQRLAKGCNGAGQILLEQVFKYGKLNFPNTVRHAQLLIEKYVIAVGKLSDFSDSQRLEIIANCFYCLLNYCGFRLENEADFIDWVQRELDFTNLGNSFRALDLGQWDFIEATPNDDFHVRAFSEVMRYAKQFDNDLQVLLQVNG